MIDIRKGRDDKIEARTACSRLQKRASATVSKTIVHLSWLQTDSRTRRPDMRTFVVVVNVDISSRRFRKGSVGDWLHELELQLSSTDNCGPSVITLTKLRNIDVSVFATRSANKSSVQSANLPKRPKHFAPRSSLLHVMNMSENVDMSHNGCPKCGAAISSGSKKCGSCGAVSLCQRSQPFQTC